MSTIKVNNIENRTGSSITIGGSSTTSLNLASTITGGTLTNTPAFKVDKTSNQSISDGVWTKVTFTQEYYDTDNAFSDSKFTVPTGKAGVYFFSSMLRCTSDNGTADYFSLAFYKDGNRQSITNQIQTAANQLQNSHIFASAHFELSEGQYIEVYGNISANNPSIGGSASQSIASFFTGFRLIGA